jgi:hypothetical protein
MNKRFYNTKTEHMDNVFMTPEDEFNTETGKWEYDAVPEKQSYNTLISWYDDFYLNYKDGMDTSDDTWTFLYDNGNSIRQEGVKPTFKRTGKESWQTKRIKNNDLEKAPRRGLVAIIFTCGDGEYFWYKNEIGKMILTEYTGWQFETMGDMYM